MAGALDGIDVSHLQSQVDWAAVARAGTTFAFVKASEGATFADPMFAQHRSAAAAQGIIVGAYHFFRPKSPVAGQITNFVGAVGSLRPGDLPPALDLEVPLEWTGIAIADRAALVSTWLQGVEGALGVPPLIYASPSFVAGILVNAPALSGHRLWLANYAPAPQVPAPWNDWTFWQYTENGTLDGVPAAIDRDRFNGDLPALQALLV